MEIVEFCKNKIDSSTEVRARIEHSLHIRNAPRGTPIGDVEHVLKTHGHRLWNQLRKRPSIGVAVVGVAGLGLALAVGVGELMIAFGAGYVAWQVLREGVPPKEAVANAIKEMRELEKL
jgi:hypothetical protein